MDRMIRWAVLLALGSLAIATVGPRAQAIDEDACRRSCYEQKTACVDACGDQDNPMECESGCEDALESCLMECS